MFGPNVRATTEMAVNFHHREPEYYLLLRDTIGWFRAFFNVSDEFDVCILTGSGTLANEAALWSMLPACGVHIHSQGGEFTSRLQKLWMAHKAESGQPRPPGKHHLMVQYETAEARLLTPQWQAEGGEGVRFADCVSSFPYYDVPPTADVWTTVTSKQLGGIPILSIAVVRKECWKYFRDASTYSYLNLRRYADAFNNGMASPHTPGMAALYDFRQRLMDFNVAALRQKIDARRALITNMIARHFEHSTNAVWGHGPTMIVDAHTLSEQLASKWRLYQVPSGFQVFLYSGTDAEYAYFIEEWETMLRKRNRR